jgi:CRP-like cAMP-binding protein
MMRLGEEMMRRYLVVADETVGGKPLLAEIGARHGAGQSRFLVLVPARVPKEGMTWTEFEARALAEDRLERVLNHLRELGVQGDGQVADADPFLAIEDALREEQFDEVILSAPSKRSGWMKPDLPGKLEATFGLPVTYVPGEREAAVRETALMRISLFAGLPKRHLRSLAKLTMVHSFREGTAIVEEGSLDESDLYTILDGRVKVNIGDRTVDHLSVGDIFGETSMLAPGPRTASVIAEAPTRCLRLPGEDVRAAMAGDAELTANMLEAAGGRLREMNRSLRDALMSLVLEGDLLERLAEAVHVEYCAAELAKGSAWADSTDDYLLRHELLGSYAGRKRDPAGTDPNLVAYDKLSEHVKEQNRDMIRDIPKKLAAAGYVMRQLGAGESSSPFSEGETELLAEREHDRWVRLKLAQGWSFASRRDEERRRHPDLVPWRELASEERQRRFGMDGASRVGLGVLPEQERQKDRALIRRIDSILARVGYTAAKVGRPVE